MRFMLGVAKPWTMQKLLLGGIAHMAAFVPSMPLVLPQLEKLGRTRINMAGESGAAEIFTTQRYCFHLMAWLQRCWATELLNYSNSLR
mmetsp:Transcript_3780/g.6252  ORF Transcript_3780/g.6252 Transcript_3780/m.6252 type:complete len:88 (+) Transcript_3780:46-309(+)